MTHAEIIKRAIYNGEAALDVALTKKTNKEGEVRYGVVLVNDKHGYTRYSKVGTWNGIGKAWNVFKAMSLA